MEEAMTNRNYPDEIRDLWQSQSVAPFEMTPEERRILLLKQQKQFRIFYSPLIPIAVLLVLAIAAGLLIHGNSTAALDSLFHYHSLMVRVGLCLMLLGGMYGFIQRSRYVKDRKACFAQAEASGNTGSLAFYRAELQQELNLNRIVPRTLIAILPGFLILEFGLASHIREGRSFFIGIFLLALMLLLALAFYFNSRSTRIYQRKIAALDALGRTPE
jgi:hypothetical protein